MPNLRTAAIAGLAICLVSSGCTPAGTPSPSETTTSTATSSAPTMSPSAPASASPTPTPTPTPSPTPSPGVLAPENPSELTADQTAAVTALAEFERLRHVAAADPSNVDKRIAVLKLASGRGSERVQRSLLTMAKEERRISGLPLYRKVTVSAVEQSKVTVSYCFDPSTMQVLDASGKNTITEPKTSAVVATMQNQAGKWLFADEVAEPKGC